MDRFFEAEIKYNYKINPTTAIISLNPLGDIVLPKPGQFYMVQVSKGIDPLLKRPLSIFSIRDGFIHFLYRIVGKGTEYLSKMPPSEKIELIGPLGNPYPIPQEGFIAIAGGTGIASIHGLLEGYPKRAYLFYGAKTEEDMVIRDQLQFLSYKTFFATDDGSFGFRGNVLDVLKGVSLANLCIYACGPHPMLHAVSGWAREMDLKCYVSMEEFMACGVGACLSCVVKTYDGLKSVCKDGPIFDSEEIVW